MLWVRCHSTRSFCVLSRASNPITATGMSLTSRSCMGPARCSLASFGKNTSAGEQQRRGECEFSCPRSEFHFYLLDFEGDLEPPFCWSPEADCVIDTTKIRGVSLQYTKVRLGMRATLRQSSGWVSTGFSSQSVGLPWQSRSTSAASGCIKDCTFTIPTITRNLHPHGSGGGGALPPVLVSNGYRSTRYNY